MEVDLAFTIPTDANGLKDGQLGPAIDDFVEAGQGFFEHERRQYDFFHVFFLSVVLVELGNEGASHTAWAWLAQGIENRTNWCGFQ